MSNYLLNMEILDLVYECNPQIRKQSPIAIFVAAKCLDTSIMIVETRVLSDSVLHPPYPTMRLEAIRRF